MTKTTTRKTWGQFVIACAIAANGVACGGTADGTSGALPSGGSPPATSKTARCTVPREMACVDQSIAGLRLLTAPNPSAITNQVLAGGVFESALDASAGGISPTQSYVYARFTATGLEKVPINDEEAFRSMDWDIALRRYIIRINGGSSGPSCVEAATSDVKDLAGLTAPSPTLVWHTDTFVEPPACTLASDQAPAGGPLTAIAGYYEYEACLAMNNAVFAVGLRTGATVALQIASYYSRDVQDHCNAMKRLPGGPSGAGQFVLRWKFLPATPAAAAAK